MADGKLVLCVPARNEVDRLPHLLDALAHQTAQRFNIVLALNNTIDESKKVIAAACRKYPGLSVIVDDVMFPEREAHAGSARRRAMDIAADLAGQDGYILTTDADTRPPPEWVACNLAAISSGPDIVGGRIALDDRETLASGVAEAWLLSDRYWHRVRAIEDAIDPVPWDPPPRHGDHTGASLCVTVKAYRDCGGVPAIPTGEDRALVRAAVRQGGQLAHPNSIWTRVSPRLDGRAANGMAEHMMQLTHSAAAGADLKLPSFSQWHARAQWRRKIRQRGGAVLIALLEDGLPPMVCDTPLSANLLEFAE